MLLTWKNPCFRHELAIQALQTGDQDDSLGPEKKEVDQNLVIENQMVELGLTQQVKRELSDITVSVLIWWCIIFSDFGGWYPSAKFKYISNHAAINKWIWIKYQIKSTPVSRKFKVRQISYTPNIIRLQYLSIYMYL